MEGWIKLHYKLLDWEWHDDPAMISLWVHLLLLANFEDKRWHDIIVKRGQFVTSLVNLQLRTGLSIQQIRTCLARLQDCKQIECKTTNKYTIVTICNFEYYQVKQLGEQQTNNKQITSNQQTNNKPTTTTEEYKNIDNNTLSPKRAHAHTHEGWQLIEEVKNSASLEAWCMQNRTTKDTFIALATQVVTEWEITELPHKNESDVKLHLFSSVKKLLKEKRNGNNRKTHSEQISDLYASVAATIARRSAEDDARKV